MVGLIAAVELEIRGKGIFYLLQVLCEFTLPTKVPIPIHLRVNSLTHTHTHTHTHTLSSLQQALEEGGGGVGRRGGV